jgi:two-component system KDP operon response regulator KdpE
VTNHKVLVVDDEPALARALAINLRAQGWQVVTASDGRGALAAVAEARPDVVVLDLGLPDMDGTDVIAGIRGWTSVPIVVLSARQHGEDKVEALDLGAENTGEGGDPKRRRRCGHGDPPSPAA